MKRRVAVGVVVLLVLYVAYREGKGTVQDWYADNYMARTTEFPSSESPDQICLTWSDDPQTTQTIQWRTAPSVSEGWVEFRPTEASESAIRRVAAERVETEDRLLENDPVNSRFTAVLTELEPDTEYVYRVGSDNAGTWSDWAAFTTAPANNEPFSFLYLGDVQRGFDFWGDLIDRADRESSDAAFVIVAGDLVNNGDYRDQWDAFFGEAGDVFRRRPLVPCLGNHDYAKEKVPQIYLDIFGLPENGPEEPGPERAYTFRYGNALFVVLDSNRAIEAQAPWLEAQLRDSDAVWKIVLFHHPVYPSAPHRENDDIARAWVPIFEKYGVALALQGHDHAYLRTYPMRAGQRVEPGEGGIVYAVSVAGNKYYDQEDHDYAEVAFTEVSTYQIIDILTEPDRLEYRAYDNAGQLRDEFTIEAPVPAELATSAN